MSNAPKNVSDPRDSMYWNGISDRLALGDLQHTAAVGMLLRMTSEHGSDCSWSGDINSILAGLIPTNIGGDVMLHSASCVRSEQGACI